VAELSPSDRALGDLLVGRRVLTLAQLDEAVRLAETWSVRLGDAILARNWITPLSYYQALAEYYDLPFTDLIRDPPDQTLLREGDADVYAQHLTIPWRRRDGRVVVATAEPGPDALLFARRQWGADVELAIASKFDVISAVQAAFTPTPCRTARCSRSPSAIRACRPARCSRRGNSSSATAC